MVRATTLYERVQQDVEERFERLERYYQHQLSVQALSAFLWGLFFGGLCFYTWLRLIHHVWGWSAL